MCTHVDADSGGEAGHSGVSAKHDNFTINVGGANWPLWDVIVEGSKR